MKNILANNPGFCAGVKLFGYVSKPVLIASAILYSFFIPYACIVLVVAGGLKLAYFGWDNIREYFQTEPDADFKKYADSIKNGLNIDFAYLPMGITLLVTSPFIQPLYSSYMLENADHYLQTKGFSLTPLANLLFLLAPIAVSMLTAMFLTAAFMLISTLHDKYKTYLIECSHR